MRTHCPMRRTVTSAPTNQAVLRGVLLAEPWMEACRERNQLRPAAEQFAFDGYEYLEADMKRDLSEIGWWLDTSAISPEATAERLVREVVYARATPRRRMGQARQRDAQRTCATRPPPGLGRCERRRPDDVTPMIERVGHLRLRRSDLLDEHPSANAMWIVQ